MVYVPLPAPLVSVLPEPEEHAVLPVATATTVMAAAVRRRLLVLLMCGILCVFGKRVPWDGHGCGGGGVTGHADRLVGPSAGCREWRRGVTRVCGSRPPGW